MTGGGGYVGSSLCSKLAERGYTVTAFDLRYPEEDQSDDIHRIKVFIIHNHVTSTKLACLMMI